MKAGRTVWVIVWLSLVMLVALWMCLKAGPAGESAFGSVVTTLIALGATQASKSTFEAIASGQGLKGMFRSLLTEEKPPEKKEATP